jgi:hypothetical protein
MLPTTYKILSNILLSRLMPYADKVVGNLHCGFQHNRSITDQYSAFIRCWRKTVSIMG